jgi:RNA polymerase sigma factor (sigma-70 family)
VSPKLSKQQQIWVKDEERLVEMLAAKTSREWPRASHKDLFQVGQVSLVEAALTYDPARGIRFGSYAYKAVRGSMLEFAKREVFGIDARCRAVVWADANDEPRVEPKSIEELLDETPGGATNELLGVAQAYAASMYVASMITATHPSPEDALSDLQREARGADALKQALATLTDQERSIVRWYYEEQRGHAYIAEQLGIAKRTVQRRIDKVVRKLNAQIANE